MQGVDRPLNRAAAAAPRGEKAQKLLSDGKDLRFHDDGGGQAIGGLSVGFLEGAIARLSDDPIKVQTKLFPLADRILGRWDGVMKF